MIKWLILLFILISPYLVGAIIGNCVKRFEVGYQDSYGEPDFFQHRWVEAKKRVEEKNK